MQLLSKSKKIYTKYLSNEKIKPFTGHEKGCYRNQRSLVDDRYKLYSEDDGETWSLFDLRNDVAEEKNIFEEYPEITASMISKFDAWFESTRHSLEGGDY